MGLPSKFVACLHSLRMMCFSWSRVKQLLKYWINSCRVLGTERAAYNQFQKSTPIFYCIFEPMLVLLFLMFLFQLWQQQLMDCVHLRMLYKQLAQNMFVIQLKAWCARNRDIRRLRMCLPLTFEDFFRDGTMSIAHRQHVFCTKALHGFYSSCKASIAFLMSQGLEAFVSSLLLSSLISSNDLFFVNDSNFTFILI